MKVPLSRPDISAEDIEAVASVLRTPHLSLGPALPRFERDIADYVGASRAVAVSSGTAALHCIVRGLGIGAGDEVVTSPFSFVASSNVLLFEGARPVFVDIDPATFDLDPSRLEDAISPQTRAVLPVHVFGRPCRIADIRAAAHRCGLPVLEDSCESLGSMIDGRHTGTFGYAGAYAFYPNKQMTTGEGGIIVTDDDDFADVCASLRNQGRSAEGGWLEHLRLGFNYRIPDILCALGSSQLARIERFIADRGRVFEAYSRRLAEIEGVIPPPPPRAGERISWFVYVVRLADDFDRATRDRALALLREGGVECRDYFAPIHLQPFYREMFGFREGDFPVTEAVAARTIALPFYNRLTQAEVDFVADRLEEVLRSLRSS